LHFNSGREWIAREWDRYLLALQTFPGSGFFLASELEVLLESHHHHQAHNGSRQTLWTTSEGSNSAFIPIQTSLLFSISVGIRYQIYTYFIPCSNMLALLYDTPFSGFWAFGWRMDIVMILYEKSNLSIKMEMHRQGKISYEALVGQRNETIPRDIATV
jgi:hypothetical protein